MEAWLAGTDYGVLLAIEINYTRRSGSRAVAGYVRFHSNRGTRVEERVRSFSLAIIYSSYMGQPGLIFL